MDRNVFPFLDGSPGSKRLLALAGGVVLILVIWMVGRWISSPTFVPLYGNLELGEAGAIEEKLRKTGVPYRLEAGGSQVMVPASEVARARVALARDGLPKGGRPGLELFDKPSWGMTDFTQRVTFQRALEGELSRTVAGIQGIEKAQVHLVLPTPSPLRKLERPASASVVLTLDSGITLTSETVQGITYVVSNSVERLSPANVAVMDDAGHVLSVPSSDLGGAGMTSWQIEIQRSVETHMAEKIEGLLTTVVGTGRVRAQVSTEMSFDQIEGTVETYDPETQVLSSEQRSETEAASTGEGASVVINNAYQTSRRLEKSLTAGGKLLRLTAAVLVDEKTSASGGRSLDLPALESMVRDAIGADSARGDRVTVRAIAFEPVAASGEQPAEKPKLDPLMMAEKIGRPLMGLMAIVGMLIVAMRAVRPARMVPVPAAGSAGGGAAGAAGESGGMPQLEGMAASGLPPAIAARSEMHSSDSAVTVLKAWLSEN